MLPWVWLWGGDGLSGVTRELVADTAGHVSVNPIYSECFVIMQFLFQLLKSCAQDFTSSNPIFFNC